MTNELRRFALLLAASDLTDKQVSAIIREIRLLSPLALTKFVRRLRMVHDAVLDVDETPRIRKSTEDVARVGNRAVAMKVQEMLRGEAGMTLSEVMATLGPSLAQEVGAPKETVATSQKVTTSQFHRWLDAILDEVPASIVLHHATAIRNRRVHTSSTDWPLKEGPDSEL